MSSKKSKNVHNDTKENKDIVDTIVVFTDGSCIKGKNKKPQCGYGIYFPNKELKHISRRFMREPFTNQRAELYAIYKAIKKIEKGLIFNKIEIYSDSEYSIKSLTEWITSWKKNDWKTSNNKQVMNQDLIKKIDKKMQKHKGKITFTHVRAHTGKNDKLSLYNAEADRLATKGARKEPR